MTFSNGVRTTPEVSVLAAGPSTALNQCRLYVPVYELAPMSKMSLTISNPNVETLILL